VVEIRGAKRIPVRSWARQIVQGETYSAVRRHAGADASRARCRARSPLCRHPKFRFEVDRRIKEEFENGRGYYGLHGRRFHVPDKPTARPDPVALIWHNENRYLG
jgi:hypothetical protein